MKRILALAAAVALCAGCQRESAEIAALRSEVLSLGSKVDALELKQRETEDESVSAGQREGRFQLLNAPGMNKWGMGVLKIDTVSGSTWYLSDWRYESDPVISPMFLWEEVATDFSDAQNRLQRMRADGREQLRKEKEDEK